MEGLVLDKGPIKMSFSDCITYIVSLSLILCEENVAALSGRSDEIADTSECMSLDTHWWNLPRCGEGAFSHRGFQACIIKKSSSR